MRHMLYAIVFFALRVCIFVVLNFTFKDRDHITYACDALVMFSFSTGVEIFWMILERLTFGYAKTHQMMRGKMYSMMYSIPILLSSFYRVRNAMRKEFLYCHPTLQFQLIYTWILYILFRVMSWWDYGYQIAGMANRTTLVDNNTWNNSHIAMVNV
jgi:hypothetical protein